MRFLLAKKLQQAADVGREPEVKFTYGEKGKGHFSSPAGFFFAKALKRNPQQIAAEIAEKIQKDPVVERAWHVAGFVNIDLSPSHVLEFVATELRDMRPVRARVPYGGKKVQLEFVSANPTGPLHVAHGRGAAVGSTLANIMRFAGVDVQREFYINDGGSQIKKLVLSVEERIKEVLGLPWNIESIEGGYKGEYLRDVAAKILEKHPNIMELPQDERHRIIEEETLGLILSWQKETLRRFRVEFDVWFSEKALRKEGWVEKTLEILRQRGFTYEKDGALWLKTTDFGDDKDRVLIKSNGEYTYFAVDVAYHLNKFHRGFEKVYDIWGADHYGHIPRMKAAMQALGLPADFLDVIIVQIVRFVISGKPVKMSKRAGTFTKLDDLIEKVGVDAARFYFLMHAPNTHMDFDLELAVKKSMDNPVYYIQYSWTRANSLLKKAAEQGIRVKPLNEALQIAQDYEFTEEEKHLIMQMADFRYHVLLSLKNLSPHFLVAYAKDLAGCFHRFYQEVPVIGATDEGQQAVRLVIVSEFLKLMGLIHDLLGISKMEEM